MSEYESVFRTFAGITVTHGALLGAAAAAYPEPFSARDHALSDLGCPITPEGLPNRASFFLFVLAMVITAVLFWRLRSTYLVEPARISNREAKICSATMGAVGSVISVVPHTLLHGIHSLGAGLFIGSLWGFDMLYFFELRRPGAHPLRGGRPAAVVGRLGLQLLLQGTVLTYAVLYVVNSPLKQIAQKIAVLGIAVVSLAVANGLTSPVDSAKTAKSLRQHPPPRRPDPSSVSSLSDRS